MVEANPTSRDRLGRIALLLVLLLALTLRAYRIDAQSLWADEGNSAALATRSLLQIAHDSAQDIHPPLYYWLLHGWAALLGTSEASLRSLSALLGVALVWLTYLIGGRLHGRPSGLLAAFLAAVNPFQVYYSQEARMYALLAVCGAGVLYGLIRWVQAGRTATRTSAGWNSLLIFISVTAGLYSHYFFAILLLAANILGVGWWLATLRSRRSWKPLVPWLSPQLAALLVFSPWLAASLRSVLAWPAPSAALPWTDSLLTAFRWMSLGPACGPTTTGLRLLPFALLMTIGLVGCRWRERQSGSSDASVRWFAHLLPVVWLGVPTAVMLALGLHREAYLKFLLVAAPAFSILLERGVTMLLPPLTHSCRAERLRRAALLAVMLAALLTPLLPTAAALRDYYHDPACVRDDYRGMAQYVASLASPTDAVLLNAPGQLEVWQYYDRSQLAVYSLPQDRPPDPSRITAQLEDMASLHGTLYCLFWATEESDPERLVESWLDRQAFKSTDVWQGNVRFVTYAFPSSGGTPSLVLTPQVLFGEHIVLHQVALLSDHAEPGGIIQVRLEWEAQAAISERYKVTLQLLDDRDQIIAQRDAEPVGEGLPTSDWPVGERVDDPHGLFIPLGTPPGRYRLLIALYDRDTGQRLHLGDGSDHLVLDTAVTTDRPTAPPPVAVLPMSRRSSHGFGEVTLLGYSLYPRGFAHAPETPLHPGDLLHLSFFWQADEAPQDDWDIVLSLAGYEALLEAPLAGEGYPTHLWQAGEIVRGEHDLRIPSDLRPGRYELLLSLSASGERATSLIEIGRVELQ